MRFLLLLKTHLDAKMKGFPELLEELPLPNNQDVTLRNTRYFSGETKAGGNQIPHPYYTKAMRLEACFFFEEGCDCVRAVNDSNECGMKSRGNTSAFVALWRSHRNSTLGRVRIEWVNISLCGEYFFACLRNLCSTLQFILSLPSSTAGGEAQLGPRLRRQQQPEQQQLPQRPLPLIAEPRLGQVQVEQHQVQPPRGLHPTAHRLQRGTVRPLRLCEAGAATGNIPWHYRCFNIVILFQNS